MAPARSHCRGQRDCDKTPSAAPRHGGKQAPERRSVKQQLLHNALAQSRILLLLVQRCDIFRFDLDKGRHLRWCGSRRRCGRETSAQLLLQRRCQLPSCQGFPRRLLLLLAVTRPSYEDGSGCAVVGSDLGIVVRGRCCRSCRPKDEVRIGEDEARLIGSCRTRQIVGTEQWQYIGGGSCTCKLIQIRMKFCSYRTNFASTRLPIPALPPNKIEVVYSHQRATQALTVQQGECNPDSRAV